jgi:hypothetical protein
MDTFYLPENLFHLTSLVEKTDDDSELQIYSYKTCDNESSEELKAYRGLVYNNSTLVASSLGYTEEYNEQQISSIPRDISNYVFFPAKEGTLLRLYFHTKWQLSTHRKLDAFKSRWGSSESFGEIFLKCLDTSFEDLTSALNPSNVYFFLVRNTKDTRIVSHPPSSYQMYHVGTLLNNQTFDMSSIGLPQQEKIENVSLQNLQEYVMMCDPFQTQGVIGFDPQTGKQVKIVNSTYQNYVRIRNNEPDVQFRFLELWRDQTSPLFRSFLDLYPQFSSKIALYTNYSYKIAKYLHNLYYKKFVQKEKIVCQKDEWSILSNVHQWFWEERTSRKVTFDVMHKMVLRDLNLHAYYRILKKVL